MNITKIDFNEFSSNIKNKEGIVLLGCGGDLDEWKSGIANVLFQEKISLSKNADEIFIEQYHLTTTGERNDLAFVINDKLINCVKLAMWRLKFGDCSWISDYLNNYADQHYDIV